MAALKWSFFASINLLLGRAYCSYKVAKYCISMHLNQGKGVRQQLRDFQGKDHYTKLNQGFTPTPPTNVPIEY